MSIFDYWKLLRLKNKIQEGFMESKVWYTSVALWGNIITTISIILKLRGLDVIDAENQEALANNLAQIGTSAGVVVGIILSIIGRWRATKVITLTKK